MRRIFLFSIISVVLLSSCAAPKVQIKTITKTIRDTIYVQPQKEDDKEPITLAQLSDYKIDKSDYPAVGQDFRQKFLIIHYTALDYEKSLRVLTEQQVSAHYLVNDNDDDEINILVNEDRRAWHAGYSYWKGRTNINDSSIGIEIVNPGYTVENDEKQFYDFPDYQFKKVAELARDIVTRYEIDPTFVLGHSDVAPQRKYDPGPKFPWKRLYEEYGIGAWYDEETKEHYFKEFRPALIDDYDFVLSVKDAFAKYGYEVNDTGYWDNKTKKMISAFQMHFRPHNYDGVLDAETWAILMALNKKYR